jgi:hypothetical protein
MIIYFNYFRGNLFYLGSIGFIFQVKSEMRSFQFELTGIVCSFVRVRKVFIIKLKFVLEEKYCSPSVHVFEVSNNSSFHLLV